MIKLPKGEYSGLVNEKAPSGANDAFYVFMDEKPYRSYPSDPPTGDWELTTRTEMAIDVAEEKVYEFTITPHSPSRKGETGMLLDYLILTKLK